MKVWFQVRREWDGVEKWEKEYNTGDVEHEQGGYREDASVSVEIPNEFYAVLQIKTKTKLRSGSLWTWEVKVSPDLPPSVKTLPMNDRALKDVLFGCEWCGIGLVDGKWRIQKRGSRVSIYPVIESPPG